jgi:hypothetical protein
MNKMMIRAAILTAALIVFVPLGLEAQDEGFYAHSYARLSYVNGAVYVQRTSDLGYEKGEVNLALIQGDILGTESGRAEVQLGQRNYLRLGDNTKVEFALLPTSGDERIGLHLTEGSLYLRVGTLTTDKGIEIDTPDASFYVLEEGLYRVDVRPNGDTRVLVREGSLEAAGEQGSKLVQTGDTLTAANGQFLGEPEYGYAATDAFDDWNGSRDELLAVRSGRQYLPTDVSEYEEELDQNGHWVYERPYGNVWVPDVSSYDDWRPYYYGRWAWYPVIGWTWISSESWGWPVYHYGRWNWRFGLGWYWIPQSHWGPAWVHWWWDGDYIGWCPLTWYNRPAYLFNNRFYDRWSDRWFSAHNRAMTVVRRDRLQDPDIGRRRLGSAELDRIGRVDLRAQQPSLRPVVDNARPQAIAARRALADRPGARTEVKTLAPSRAVPSSGLRPARVDQGLRSRDGQASSLNNNRGAASRPGVRGGSASGREIRTYPSSRVPAGRDQSTVARDRGGVATYPSRRTEGGLNGRSGENRGTGSQQGQDRVPSRGSTVREQPQGARTSSGERARPTSSGGQSVRSYPSTTRTVRSGSGGVSNSSAGRSQSRTYSSPSSVTRPSPRLSSSSRSSSVSAGSSRSRSPYSSGVRAGSSVSSPSRPGSVSSSRSRGSSGRSFSAPRSSRSSSGRSYSSSRSSGSSRSSSRSSRSGGSSSGGSRSSSSKSSGSSSRSSGRKR